MSMCCNDSLTPPQSPGLTDSEPMIPGSPVLVGKSFSRKNGMIDRSMHELEDYPAPVLCHRPIYGTAYGQTFYFDDTGIGRAYNYWNSFPMVDVASEPHICRGCRKNVMGETRCLKLLEDTKDCTNIFYEALMYFQDLGDCAELWIRCPSAESREHATAAKKYRKFLSETLQFVSEFVQCNEEGQVNVDSIINIINLLVMVSNQSQLTSSLVSNQMQTVLLDGLEAIVREDLEMSESGRIRTSPLCEWWHTYVDIQCTFLQILPVASKSVAVCRHFDSIQLLHDNGTEIVHDEFCWKLIKSIFSQIMKLSIEKYIQLQRKSMNDKGHFVQSVLFRSSPFPCLCVQQLLALCLHVAVKTREARSSAQVDLNSMDSQPLMPSLGTYADGNPLDGAAPTFWKMVLTYISAVIQDSQRKNKPKEGLVVKGPVFQSFDSVQDALSFCWWWTWHVAHITSFDFAGNYQVDSSTLCPCTSLLSRLLRLSLTSCEGDDKLLASHMMCYQAISSFYRKSSTAPRTISSVELAHCHLLWAHFSKKLNVSKKSDSLGMHRYTLKNYKNLSPRDWISKCEKCTVYEKVSLAGDSQAVHEDPFKVFLSIFGEIVGLGGWSSIKDRFYSRLQPKEIKELSDCGLTRLFLLHLIVALSDVSRDERNALFSKLTEHISITTLLETDYRKRKTLINGLFACVSVANRYSLKAKSIATKCGRTISYTLKIFSESGRKLDQRNSLWNIIAFYFRNLSEIFQNSRSFDLHQELLLPDVATQTALLKANSGELSVVLESFFVIISSLKSHVQRSSMPIFGVVVVFNSICNFYLPWLKEIAKTEENIAEEIVNAATELCFLTLEIGERSPNTSLAVKLSTLLEHFGSAVDVRLKLRLLFLIKLLSQERDKMVEYLNRRSAECNSSRLVVIQGALKCIVSLPRQDDQDHLMRCLCQIEPVKEVLLAAGCTDNPTFDGLLRSLEKRYELSKTFVQRKEQKDQVFCWFRSLSDVLHSFSKSFVTMETESTLNLYKSCAAIVSHCCRILYSAGKSGVVVQIFDTLILPRWIYQAQDKNIQPQVMRALTHTLHLYFRSLLSLDFKRDSYLQRVLSNIVSVYLTRFSATSNSAPHPFRRVLDDPTLVPDQTCALLRMMKDHCRTGPNLDTKLTMVIVILHFWTEHLERRLDQGEKALIRHLLEQSRVKLRSLPAVIQKSDALRSFCSE